MSAERANKVLEKIGSTMRVTTADHIVESKIKEFIYWLDQWTSLSSSIYQQKEK